MFYIVTWIWPTGYWTVIKVINLSRVVEGWEHDENLIYSPRVIYRNTRSQLEIKISVRFVLLFNYELNYFYWPKEKQCQRYLVKCCITRNKKKKIKLSISMKNFKRICEYLYIYYPSILYDRLMLSIPSDLWEFEWTS